MPNDNEVTPSASGHSEHDHSVKNRLLIHADYLGRQGRRSLAADLRGLIEGMESIAALAEAHVSGGANVSPEAIAIAARKFLEAGHA